MAILMMATLFSMPLNRYRGYLRHDPSKFLLIRVIEGTITQVKSSRFMWINPAEEG